MPIKTLHKIPKVTREHVALILVTLSISIFGVAAVLAINKISTTSRDANADARISKALSVAVIEGAHDNCVKFGNPLRKGLREYFQDQLDRLLHPDPRLLERFDLTAQEARELSAAQIKQYNYDINVRFKDVPCGKVYNVNRAQPRSD